MSAFSIRLARPEDAEALPGIEREAATAFADDPDSAAIDPARVIPADEHRRLIARGHCLVAEAQGEAERISQQRRQAFPHSPPGLRTTVIFLIFDAGSKKWGSIRIQSPL